ncbi:hypothetical protein DFJ73DRAFT_781537 [Zopfochytrium polystomum]|nr:hypothetical protein DFJ73DRAFT_781537 [Zopfochytrium polystomum]
MRLLNILTNAVEEHDFANASPSYLWPAAAAAAAAADAATRKEQQQQQQVVVPWSSAALITAARDSSGGGAHLSTVPFSSAWPGQFPAVPPAALNHALAAIYAGRATVLDADDGQPKQRFTRLWTLQECVLPSKLFFLVPAGTKTQAEGTATVTTRLVTTSNGSTAALQRERRIGDRQRPTPGRSVIISSAVALRLLPLTVRKASVRTALLLSSVRECRYPVDRLHGILGLLPRDRPDVFDADKKARDAPRAKSDATATATATTSANTLSWFGGFQPGLFCRRRNPRLLRTNREHEEFLSKDDFSTADYPPFRIDAPRGVLLRQVPVVQVSTIDCGEPAFFTKDNVFYSESAAAADPTATPTSPKQTIFSRARAALTTAAQHAAALTEAAASAAFRGYSAGGQIPYPQPLYHASAARIREAVDAAGQIVLVLAGSAVGNDFDDPLHAFGAALADVYAVCVVVGGGGGTGDGIKKPRSPTTEHTLVPTAIIFFADWGEIFTILTI